MVLKNLCTGQQWRNRQRTMDMGRWEERVRCMERATYISLTTWKLILPCVKQIAMEICCLSQGTQTGAVYQPRGVGWMGDGREVQKGGDICIPNG